MRFLQIASGNRRGYGALFGGLFFPLLTVRFCHADVSGRCRDAVPGIEVTRGNGGELR